MARLGRGEELRPGAHADAEGTTFVALSSRATEVAVRFFGAGRSEPLRTEALDPVGAGRFAKDIPGVAPGALYKLVLDGVETPDPYARSLPAGVHGPAQVVARAVEPPLREPPGAASWIIYELHVGTFSPEGTFRGAEARLGALVELGVTAIELLPVASFAGERGWGYDGVALFAPHAAYGSPDDLRSLVRAAHSRGIAVILDVVYNHFGPDGNYLLDYAPEYFTKQVATPWGPAPDYAHAPMRRLALDNARYWLEELGFDGLRLDATHAIHDPSELHVLRELTELAHSMSPPRRIFFEDERNDPTVISELGADGVWADDFHHQIHVLLTGERDGYYAAYEATVAALASTIGAGWTYSGQAFAPWQGKPRGKSARERGLLPEHLVYCIQNHDQVGNRALGTRLTEHVDVDAFCAASVLLLALPFTPLLFMGQEWGATSPFLFFSDHRGELGEAVRKGRREEFAAFAAFADPEARASIPDPQDRGTFERSKLVWEERSRAEHERILVLHRAMIALRRTDPVLSRACRWEGLEARAHGRVLEVVRKSGRASRRVLVNFGGAPHALDALEALPASGRASERLLYASGSFDGAALAPRSAVLFGCD